MPALYEIALRNPGIHIAEHATFLGTGLLYWYGLVQATRPARGGQGPAILPAFVTILHTNILGALLTFASRPWYSYGRWPEYWGLTPLEDQQLSGLIMWIPMGTVYMLAALWIVWTCLSGLTRAQFSLVDERPAVVDTAADGEEG
jgi:putative membrane protein